MDFYLWHLGLKEHILLGEGRLRLRFGRGQPEAGDASHLAPRVQFQEKHKLHTKKIQRRPYVLYPIKPRLQHHAAPNTTPQAYSSGLLTTGGWCAPRIAPLPGYPIR